MDATLPALEDLTVGAATAAYRILRLMDELDALTRLCESTGNRLAAADRHVLGLELREITARLDGLVRFAAEERNTREVHAALHGPGWVS